VLGHLGALVDKSLVQFDHTGTGPGQYRLLETVRQYAAGRLDAAGPAAVGAARIAHRDYYLALAEAAAPQLMAADQAEWLSRLDAELGNLRAAIAVSLTQPDSGPGLRLGAALREYWGARGYAAEGADVLRALLDAPTAREATLPRARALAAAAYLLGHTGGYAIAGDYCQEALAIAAATGDDHLVADLSYVHAGVLLHQGQPDAALPVIEQGLGLSRRLQEPHLTGRLLVVRSFVRNVGGDLVGAARDITESLQLFRQAGDRRGIATMLGNLGSIELSMGDLDAATRHLVESLDTARALDARDDIVYGTFKLGLAKYLNGSPDVAEALFAESFELARRAQMRAATAYALTGLAMGGRGGAGPGRSARLHGAADQAIADLGETIAPLEGQLADLDRQRLRAAMGAQAFEAEYAAGRALDPAQVAHEARHGRQAERAGALVGEPDAAVSGEAMKVLTPRELDVLKLVAQGLSNPDIARRLFLSEHTVHRHLANILRKLGLSSRSAAAAWGARAGLV